eukprot:6205100-Pleurochrysis_carterae.AAC.1
MTKGRSVVDNKRAIESYLVHKHANLDDDTGCFAHALTAVVFKKRNPNSRSWSRGAPESEGSLAAQSSSHVPSGVLSLHGNTVQENTACGQGAAAI